MSSPHGIKLAAHIISTNFGDIVCKVCECLLRKGPLSQLEVTRFTELTKQKVTDALLVLIHHNCVQAFTIQQPGGFGEPPKIMTKYMALPDNIIHHMRFPKFLSIVSDEFGQDCAEIFEGLLQHGRLSLNQTMDRYKDKHKASGENSSATNVVHENFSKLAQARYIERCPAHEPFLEPLEEGAKKRAKSKIADATQTLEARALAAAAPMESQRFLVEADTLIGGVLDDEDSKKSSTTDIVGEKRKLEPETESWETNERKEILWRVNFEEFIRRLRHKSCVSHVTERVDSVAGIVLSAIFEASRKDETRVKTEKTVPLLLETIYEEAMKTEEGRSLTLERVRAALVQLGCELPTIGIDETYSIDLKKIIYQAQAQEVESIVLKKYGREAYRIFRLLSERERRIETDKISSTTFVEKKDALKILFQLWKDDYLNLERVGNEAQKMEIMLWELNKRSVWEQVLDDMYHAALNLKLRLVHELDHAQDLLRVLKGKSLKEGDEAAKMRKKVQDKWKVLEASFMILDDAIMLFHDF
ncbi:putative RNA polymerase III Rpc82, C -terminal, winged helix-like DNA-binding domain superfamily [Helianthus annuus]|uniref:DNA-directed RNA polymerase III subunit RPC3 n=1 Tax=Helianthus annuus TaxID=4232 RepID=A0A9K3EEY3_HELAN|nr:DNA-directed RNA polymerase III subunit RPC3 [Helianthus annuus]KAF5772342.1 putative RNA polymerase III Rpc82, C -terminal, winged helix-like DNA-binding domain superfamily [Helianthus annuus]KAJ0475966.1 putative RNA polymerase III Rpc82, C -terminal, winged helix-like DNA-binding domain superfamily [Helianthus annuus]KAJ0496775.1 putative RNA polymerase III Rpc82, C -terminal, winged helix-like DNA-binding domain superfamily [Helianthus annuus]